MSIAQKNAERKAILKSVTTRKEAVQTLSLASVLVAGVGSTVLGVFTAKDLSSACQYYGQIFISTSICLSMYATVMCVFGILQTNDTIIDGADFDAASEKATDILRTVIRGGSGCTVCAVAFFLAGTGCAAVSNACPALVPAISPAEFMQTLLCVVFLVGLALPSILVVLFRLWATYTCSERKTTSNIYAQTVPDNRKSPAAPTSSTAPPVIVEVRHCIIPPKALPDVSPPEEEQESRDVSLVAREQQVDLLTTDAQHDGPVPRETPPEVSVKNPQPEMIAESSSYEKKQEELGEQKEQGEQGEQ